MRPHPGIRQPPGDQLPQGQLDALLLDEARAGARPRSPRGGHQARMARRGALQQLLHPKPG